MMVSKRFFYINLGSNIWVFKTNDCVKASFVCNAGAFLYRFFAFSKWLWSLFYKMWCFRCFTLWVVYRNHALHLEISALRASFSLFKVLALIRLILLQFPSGLALLTGITYVILAIEVITGYSSICLPQKIYFKNPLVALISGFNLFRHRFFFNWSYFFINAISSNLKLSHSLVKLFLFHGQYQNNVQKEFLPQYCSTQ